MLALTCRIPEMNFHEKALFVKPTWRLLAFERYGFYVSFALCFHPL